MSDGNENEFVGQEVNAAPPSEVAALRARLLQAELRAEAIRAGMVDLDGVKLIEPAAVTVNEAGELVEGPG